MQPAPCIFSIVLLLLQFSTSAQSNNGGRNYALVIGISQYENKQIPALQFSNKDAAIFAAYLQTRPSNKVSEDRMLLLTNEKATISAIYNGLDWLKENCRKDDTAYIYFSGHGDLEVKTNFSIGYLLAYNSPPNNYRNNAIRLEDINDVANTLTIKNLANVILITDACHSGKLAGDFQKGKQFVASQLRLVLNNEVRLTACGPDELAAEGVNWGGGRGIFSYYLLQGLSGAADKGKDGTVKLDELTGYLDSAFAADKFLTRDKLKQKPILDGHPYFPLSAGYTTPDTTAGGLNRMMGFSALRMQPIDYFFAYLNRSAPESLIDFKNFAGVPAKEFPSRFVAALYNYTKEKNREMDSLDTHPYIPDYALPAMDSLQQLLSQLKNPQLVSRFNERFIQFIHEKGQDMINAYLQGDLAELERRQYYYKGNRNYIDFLDMHQLAVEIVTPEHYLARLLSVQHAYIGGLTQRLEMTVHSSTDSFMRAALQSQYAALKLEPYAAYIHNELGNLLLNKEQYDSAAYHFDLATTLAPTWSIPWSNKARLYLAKADYNKANTAFQKADSLQPDLAFNLMNGGLLMEKQQNLLAAETYYQRAKKLNNVHFFPYERLAQIHLLTGDFDEADYDFFQARTRKKDFTLNDASFRFGLELGGAVGILQEAESLSQRYKLAGKLEMENKLDEAVQQYLLISDIENRLQMDQAVYKGFVEPVPRSEEEMDAAVKYFARYENPIAQGGAVKASRLLEQMQQYEQAEKVLLAQVEKSRKAGDARQQSINAKKPGTWQMKQFGGIEYNYYWFNINAALEAETYNFYNRITEKYPREGTWKEKASLFLYKRLLMACNLLSPEEYDDFHTYLKDALYPFRFTDEEASFVLPGTSDTVHIAYEKYDPLARAVTWMEQAIKLSGDKLPRREILEPWARLNAWNGRTEPAVEAYRGLLKMQPDNRKRRLEFIDYLEANKLLTEACEQLDSLYKGKQADNERQLQLANYIALSGKYSRARQILLSMRPKDAYQKNSMQMLRARMFWMEGDYRKALKYFNDSITFFQIAEDDPEGNMKADQNLQAMYWRARAFAMLDMEQEAMSSLTEARMSQFNFGNVLEYDDVWIKLRKTAGWKLMKETYPYETEYGESGAADIKSVLQYMIPNFKSIYH